MKTASEIRNVMTNPSISEEYDSSLSLRKKILSFDSVSFFWLSELTYYVFHYSCNDSEIENFLLYFHFLHDD